MTSRLPDLDGLRLVVAIAHEGGIGAAARALGVTQQSASQRLRSVEAQVGLTLVRRTRVGSALTEDGRAVVQWAARLLDLADEIDHAIDGLRADRDRELTVWASMTVAESLLPAWLVRLRHRQQAEGREPTTVALVAGNSAGVAEAVRDQRADVGFVEGARAPAGLRSTAVSSDDLVLVTNPPRSRRRRPLRPEEVAALGMTVREPGSGTREVLELALAEHDLRLHGPLVELTTGQAVRATVLAGGPPAFLSRRTVGADLEAGVLVEVPTAGLDLARTLRAVWLGAERPPAGPVRELVGIARSGGATANR